MSRFLGKFFEYTFHAALHERLSFSIHLAHVCRPLFSSRCCFFLLSECFLLPLHLLFSLFSSSVLLLFGLFVELLHGVGSCAVLSFAWMGVCFGGLGWVPFRIVVASIFVSFVWYHGRLGVCTTFVGRSCMILRWFLRDWFSRRRRDPSFFFQQFSILDFAHQVSIPFLFQSYRPRTHRSHVRPSVPHHGTRTCPIIVVDAVRTCFPSCVSSLVLVLPFPRVCRWARVRTFLRSSFLSVFLGGGFRLFLHVSFAFRRVSFAWIASCLFRTHVGNLMVRSLFRSFVVHGCTFSRIPFRGLGTCEGVKIHATLVVFLSFHPRQRVSCRVVSNGWIVFVRSLLCWVALGRTCGGGVDGDGSFSIFVLVCLCVCWWW